MVTAGIDIGARNTRVVLLADGEAVSRAQVRTAFDPPRAAEQALREALDAAGIAGAAPERRVATGAGRRDVTSDRAVTEPTAAARGIHAHDPHVRTVIDVGAEECRGIRVGEDGRVADFVVNDRCASGTGAFTEAMARAMDMSLEEFGRISLLSGRHIPINAQCAVFAESEVVSLVHSDTAPEDIARAVHDAIAARTASMVRRIGIEEKVALVGGMSLNVGFRASLERSLETRIIVPDHPEFTGALGAARIAAGEEPTP